jgi:hypothetical protein
MISNPLSPWSPFCRSSAMSFLTSLAKYHTWHFKSSLAVTITSLLDFIAWLIYTKCALIFSGETTESSYSPHRYRVTRLSNKLHSGSGALYQQTMHFLLQKIAVEGLTIFDWFGPLLTVYPLPSTFMFTLFCVSWEADPCINSMFSFYSL